MPVGDRPHLLVPEMHAHQQVLVVEVVLRAVGRDLGAVAPPSGQRQAQIQLGHVAVGGVQLLQAHVMAIGVRQLVWRHLVGQVSRCLVDAKPGTHGKGGEQVAGTCVANPGVIPGQRPEVSREAGPVVDVEQDVQQVARHDPVGDGGVQCNG